MRHTNVLNNNTIKTCFQNENQTQRKQQKPNTKKKTTYICMHHNLRNKKVSTFRQDKSKKH